MREASLVTKIIKEVRRRCPLAYCRKLADRFTRGLPDVLVIAPYRGTLSGTRIGARTILIECKRPGKKADPLQEVELAQARRAGAFTLVATSVQDVVDCLIYLGCCAKE